MALDFSAFTGGKKKTINTGLNTSAFGGGTKTDNGRKTFDFPEALGGGSFYVGEPGELVQDEKNMGPRAPGQWREHIFPWALGGTSPQKGEEEHRNIDIYSKEQGREKTDFELDQINKYKKGEITLNQARANIIQKYRQVTGEDPSTDYTDYLTGFSGLLAKGLRAVFAPGMKWAEKKDKKSEEKRLEILQEKMEDPSVMRKELSSFYKKNPKLANIDGYKINVEELPEERLRQLYVTAFDLSQEEGELIRRGLQDALLPTGGRAVGELSKVIRTTSKTGKVVEEIGDALPSGVIRKADDVPTPSGLDTSAFGGKKINFDNLFDKKTPSKADEFVAKAEETRKLDQMQDKVIHLTDSNEYIEIPKNFTKEQRIKLFDEVKNIPSDKKVVHISDPKVSRVANKIDLEKAIAKSPELEATLKSIDYKLPKADDLTTQISKAKAEGKSFDINDLPKQNYAIRAVKKEELSAVLEGKDSGDYFTNTTPDKFKFNKLYGDYVLIADEPASLKIREYHDKFKPREGNHTIGKLSIPREEVEWKYILDTKTGEIKTKSQLKQLWDEAGKTPKKEAPKTPKKEAKSITAKKLNESLPDSYKLNEDYDSITLKKELDRASREIADNKEKAMAKAFDSKEKTARRIAKLEELAQIAKRDGDYEAVNRLFAEANKLGTETAQGLNMMKALYAVNPEYSYIQKIINTRLSKISVGTKDIKKARDMIKRKATEIKTKTRRAVKLENAQELLDKIMCK